MTGTRLILPALAAFVVAAATDAAIFPRKKLDANRVKQLADTLRTEPDERKRRAAVAELKEADPRVHPDATLALVWALQRDPSPAVRADAAEAMGQMKVMVPLAGVALETAAESDPSPAVRDAAQQALWEYHLIGYRSTKGADGIAGQTIEPPRAKPPTPRPTIVQVAAPAVPTPVEQIAVMPRPVSPRPPAPSNPPPITEPPGQ
ncbi:MAG TPA: HEAT repeat domain-containing protein, partial [Gemmataceae bacterium]|nr:HEAT repeat domain-containing protein [Gemmataceae bacterium]